MKPYSSLVVIPVYKASLSHTECISLTRCAAVLKEKELVLVGPESLDYTAFQAIGEFSVQRFDDRFFSSLESYSELLLSQEFYSRFQQFDYMLIHQLDAFVFSDRLEDWCRKGYDYIGAPWQDDAGRWKGVGNGGFSLRRIESCLKVLQSEMLEDPGQYWEYLKIHASPLGRILRYPRKVLKHFGINNDVKGFLRKFMARGCPEDMFWGLHAARFDSSFVVAPVEDALDFSIEAGLEDEIGRFEQHPPFGCHREWFLEMLDRYMHTRLDPMDSYERAVWHLASVAGIPRGGDTV